MVVGKKDNVKFMDFIDYDDETKCANFYIDNKFYSIFNLDFVSNFALLYIHFLKTSFLENTSENKIEFMKNLFAISSKDELKDYDVNKAIKQDRIDKRIY